MSRIAVVTSTPSMSSEGGHLVIARALVRALEDEGHRASVVLTPQNRFGRQAAAYLATWLTDVGVAGDGSAIDQVISLRYPSYAVRHPVHVCWLNHTMREYYDLWESFSSGLSARGRAKESVRRWLIHRADRFLLRRNVTRLFAQSRTVQSRLRKWGDLASEVLYPPAPQRAYRCDAYDGYLFAVSRLAAHKRFDLLLRALAEPVAARVRCVIAGEGEAEAELRALVATLRLSDRVTLAGRLTEAQLLDHLAKCRAVCFPPFQEDYGFVTVEAFACRKAVITCADSGGPAELVQQAGGPIAAPTPAALAESIAAVMHDEGLAMRLGQQGHEVGASLNWPATVRRLVIV
jgi:glycosyltransferase involved in cell wall biosynthesis